MTRRLRPATPFEDLMASLRRADRAEFAALRET